MAEYLAMMAVGYTLTVVVETAVLWFALSTRHPPRVRLFAGVWLTACTYPVVWLVLPDLFAERWAYLLVAETFAPAAECALFWAAFVRNARSGVGPDSQALGADESNRWATVRDMAAVTVANLCSFAVGEVLTAAGFWELA